jgi:hypothetical protein
VPKTTDSLFPIIDAVDKLRSELYDYVGDPDDDDLQGDLLLLQHDLDDFVFEHRPRDYRANWRSR